jgi:hypothetical protein
LIILIMLGEGHKIRSFSLCNVPQPPIISSLFGRNTEAEEAAASEAVTRRQPVKIQQTEILCVL